MAPITFDIQQKIAVLSSSEKGWSKQLNLISWNGREPKYDIRDWDETFEKMGRGISLTRQELLTLHQVITRMLEQEKEGSALDESVSTDRNWSVDFN